MPLKYHAGDKFPEFSLSDHTGQATSLDKLLAQGPLLLVFFRGPW